METIPGTLQIPNAYSLKFGQQVERFRWLADGLKRRIESIDLLALENFLFGPLRWPGQREKALVSLALIGDADAGNLIAEFDPGDDEVLEIFHAICADYWAKGSL